MSAPITARRDRLARGALIAGGVGVGALLQLAALRAAGLNGTAPSRAGSFKQLISTLTGNWEWRSRPGSGWR